MTTKTWNKLTNFMEEFLTNILVDEEEVSNVIKTWGSKQNRKKVMKILTGPKPRQKKDPNKPKGAKSSFIFFCGEVRDKVKADYPDEKAPDIGRRCGEMWRSLTDAKKKKYITLAKKDRERFNREMKDYTPPEPTETQSGTTTKNKKNKKNKNVKGPRSSYILFCDKVRPTVKEENPDMKFAEVSGELGKLWRKLTEEEKTLYKELAKKDKERYIAECNEERNTSEEKDENKEKEDTVKQGENAFLKFSTELRPQLKEEHPKWKAHKLTREIQKRWKEQNKEQVSAQK